MMVLLLPLLLLFSLAASTSILLPLYVYPSDTFNDNAARWQSLLTTVRAHRDDTFYVIVNPDSGPGGAGFGKDDVNYVSGVTQLNAEPNVHTVGYVHTDYGSIPADNIIANVTAWASWPAPYQMKGIFFDETPNGNGRTPDESTYMADLASRTRTSGFASPTTLVFNVGQKVVDANFETYFSAADIVIVFEESFATYQRLDPVVNNVPTGQAAKSSIMVHTFNSDLATLERELRRISAAGIGSTWWTTTDYSTYTQPPANAENQAVILP